MSNDKKNSNKRKKVMRYVGLGMAVVEMIVAIIFAGMILWLNMVPDKYVIGGCIVLALITAFIIYTQFTRVHWVGKMLAVLLSVILILGDVYIYQAKGTISSVTDNTKKDVVSVYVLKDDPAKTIGDAANYKFGYHSVLDKTTTEETIADINKGLGKSIATQTYTDFTKLVDALYNKEVGAIIVKDSYIATLEESHPTFIEDTRVIDNKTFETEIKKPVITKNTLTDTFTIYLSGNDEVGDLNQAGRSDVNILIEVNPKTKQILLVNTPRDYYVNVNSLSSGIGKDKLTHAGNFGVDASMATMSGLYKNWDIDYFVRVNFTGVEAIVDALGGITVNSELDFYTSPDTSDVKFHFTEGKNEVNGKAALAFCRERQSIAGGDNQRGKNQMIAIQGIVDKVASPSILYNYSSVLNSVKSMFQTSLEDDDIASMVKLTMDGEPWNVQSYAVDGVGDYDGSYFFGYTYMYVMRPNQSAVDTACKLMQKIKDGEIFDVDEYVNGGAE